MERFLEELQDRTNRTLTENLAETRKTTGSDVLDFFSKGGSLRKRDTNDIKRIFSRAFVENKLLALKCLFYIRDIRGGLGERRTFRVILNHLANHYPSVTLANIEHVPFFGRWDDLYAAFDTPIEEYVAQFMKETLIEDIKTVRAGVGHPSLLAKWLKSENASSDETKRLAYKTMEHFGMTPKDYRKTLSLLREEIGVVERLMSQNRWEEINFEEVPSQASRIYRDAFKRNQPKRYEKFLEDVSSGERKINAGATFPYEIIRPILKDNPDRTEIKMLDEQWKALPDYECTEHNAMAVIDTSGSMFWDGGMPAMIALSLGLYFAEHNDSEVLGNKFITFSSQPDLVEIKGNNIEEKITNMKYSDWGRNTNIEAVFDMILDIAIKNELSPDEIPSKLYVITDLEFDRCVRDSSRKKTLFQKIESRFDDTPYDMPFLVFWNVDARNDQSPVKMDEAGFQLVSGASPNIFKWVVDTKATSPYELMLEVLSDDRYDRIKPE